MLAACISTGTENPVISTGPCVSEHPARNSIIPAAIAAANGPDNLSF